jgi:hypothetical protein
MEKPYPAGPLTAKEDRDKIASSRRGGDEVVAAWQELFPNSRLPFFDASFSGWSSVGFLPLYF